MRMAGKRVIEVKVQRFLALEFVFWSRKFVAAAVSASLDMDGNEENDNFGKGKCIFHQNKQTGIKLKDARKEEKKEIDIVGFVKLMKEKLNINDEDSGDIISRSPMRKHECHHGSSKPYDYPYSESRVYNGVTRVVESDRTNPAYSGRLRATLTTNATTEGHSGDIDLCDVSTWLNLCRRDPKLLSDFVEDCQNELSKRELPNFCAYITNRNGCSKVSSQTAFPAQSPSDRSVTSPESTLWDESSLYQCKSPNILYGKSRKRCDKDNEPCSDFFVSPGAARVNGYVPNFQPFISNLTPVSEKETTAEAATSRETRVFDSFPNIGTVMLNLAADSYESTIDLNKFSTVCETQVGITSAEAIPTEVATTTTTATTTSVLESERNETSGTGTNIWASAATQRDALNQRLDPKAKKTAWARISQLDIDILGKGDKDGDTQLMILLVSEKLTLEYVYVIVERLLKEKPEYLSLRNDLNQDALYLAALKLTDEPLVTSYLAEALVRGKQSLNTKYDNGNTLLHYLARKGDTHSKVLERLVKLKCPNGTSLFDVNKKNNRGFTPLHVACETHSREVNARQTVRILVENGADCVAKDYKDENTPLHVLINESCDIDLVRILLESERRASTEETSSTAIVPNRQGNTPLHLSCSKNSLPIRHQEDLIRLLLSNGAMIQLKNINGYVPSVLLDGTRKQKLKAILHGHRQRPSPT